MEKENYIKEQYELLETLKCEYEIENFNRYLNWKINFGKYKGETYATLISCYPSYLDWAIEKKMIHEKVVECYKLRKRIQSLESQISYSINNRDNSN